MTRRWPDCINGSSAMPPTDELLDVAYRTVDSPVGTLLLAATTVGLVRVAYDIEDHDAVLATLAGSVSPRVLRAPARLDAVARQLDEYFTKRRTDFEVPVDLRLAEGFRRSVIEHLRDIGYGRRESYAEVAAAVGNPRAVRAVGTACAHNPLPVVIPCHRVVRSDGSTGQYVGGPAAKSALLDARGRRGMKPARAAVEQRMKLNDAAREFIGQGADATLVTLNPDGSPQVTVVWVALQSTPDGDELVTAHLAEHKKVRNMRQDSAGCGHDHLPRRTGPAHAALPGNQRDRAHRRRRGARTPEEPGPGDVRSDECFPPDNSPPGFLTRIRIDKVGGVGPWVP